MVSLTQNGAAVMRGELRLCVSAAIAATVLFAGCERNAEHLRNDSRAYPARSPEPSATRDSAGQRSAPPPPLPAVQIYRNERFGFTMFVPADWSVSPSSNGDGANFEPGVAGVRVLAFGEVFQNRLRVVRPYRDQGFDVRSFWFPDQTPGFVLVHRDGDRGVLQFVKAQETVHTAYHVRMEGPVGYLYDNFFRLAAISASTVPSQAPIPTPLLVPQLRPVIPQVPSYFYPDTSERCNPNYGPDCLELGVDYDCSNNSFEDDGPNYLDHPIRVLGDDEYGLDGDSDGEGCEEDD
jgi:hypothetical protein